MSVPYICYTELKEFHTLKEVCELFRMEKRELKKKCETYGIHPRRNEIGEWGLVKYDVRKLHNRLYHEEDEDQAWNWEDNPWA